MPPSATPRPIDDEGVAFPPTIQETPPSPSSHVPPSTALLLRTPQFEITEALRAAFFVNSGQLQQTEKNVLLDKAYYIRNEGKVSIPPVITGVSPFVLESILEAVREYKGKNEGYNVKFNPEGKSSTTILEKDLAGWKTGSHAS